MLIIVSSSSTSSEFTSRHWAHLSNALPSKSLREMQHNMATALQCRFPSSHEHPKWQQQGEKPHFPHTCSEIAREALAPSHAHTLGSGREAQAVGPWPCEERPGCPALVVAGSGWSQLVPTGSIQSWLLLDGPGQSRLVPVCSLQLVLTVPLRRRVWVGCWPCSTHHSLLYQRQE